MAAYLKFGWSPVLWFRDWPFLVILVAVTFIDLEHRLIPDVLSLGGLALGLSSSFWVQGLGWQSSVIGAALGFTLFYLLAWAYEKRAGRSGLGGGDIKLLAMLGAFLGPAGVMTTVLVSSVSGSILGLAYAAALRKRGTAMMQTAIPYGPFLVLGGLVDYFFGEALGWFRFTTQI